MEEREKFRPLELTQEQREMLHRQDLKFREKELQRLMKEKGMSKQDAEDLISLLM